VDLLLHVVAVGAQVDRIRREVAQVLHPVDGLAGGIDHLDALAAHGHDIAILEIHHAPRLGNDGGDVGGEEILAFAQAHHIGQPMRAPVIVSGPRSATTPMAYAPRRSAAAFWRARKRSPVAFEVVVHEMAMTSGVGLRLEHVAQGFQAARR